jgi:hypothetical protein
MFRQWVTGRSEPVAVAKRVDEAALPPYKAAELANLTPHELQLFMDPTYTDAGGSENLKLLMEIKIKHINEFHRWMPEATPEAPDTRIDATRYSK